MPPARCANHESDTRTAGMPARQPFDRRIKASSNGTTLRLPGSASAPLDCLHLAGGHGIIHCMVNNTSTISEADILADVVGPAKAGLSPRAHASQAA